MPKKTNPTQRLVQALFLSGGLNVILLTFAGYAYLSEKTLAPVIEQKPAPKQALETPLAIDQSCNEVIRYFLSLPYGQLIEKLHDPCLVENGYTKRDLALAILATCHHFDLPRALKGLSQPLQKRLISYEIAQNSKPSQIIAYPGLTDHHFRSIILFARTEKWPQTSRGLFLNLRRQSNIEPSLADAFFLTPEFSAVETLFKRAEINVDKIELLNVIKEGSWPLLFRFAEQQKVAQDLSPAKRQRFLLDYIKMSSKSAAYLLLKTDGPFASKKLDDESVLAILNLIDCKTSEAEKFALDLLTNPRSDQVWKLAASRLYEYAGEPKPEKSLHHAALIRFVPQASLTQPLSPKEISVKENLDPAPQKPNALERTYIVQNGDSLWRISRRFHVEIDAIRLHNNIEGDFLHPGNVLRIPKKE